MEETSSEKRGFKRVRIDEEAIIHLPEMAINDQESTDSDDINLNKLTNKIEELQEMYFELRETHRMLLQDNLALKVYINNLEKSIDHKNGLIDKLRFELRFFDIAFQRILHENKQIIARIDKENEEIEKSTEVSNEPIKQEKVNKIFKQDKCVLM